MPPTSHAIAVYLVTLLRNNSFPNVVTEPKDNLAAVKTLLLEKLGNGNAIALANKILFLPMLILPKLTALVQLEALVSKTVIAALPLIIPMHQ
jgi:hypothetical protein